MAGDAAVMRDPADAASAVGAQARLWSNALRELGFAVRHLDEALRRADADELEAALDGCRVALVENLCSVPAYPRAAHVAAAVSQFAARGGHVVFHHHELPWEPPWRDAPGLALPPRLDNAMHIAVSLRARRDLHAHRYAPVVTVHDHFDFEQPTGDRNAARAARGISDGELVLYQPTAATRHTNVAGAVRYITMLHALIPNQPLRFWLEGPIDDAVASTVARLLDRCPVPVTVGDVNVDRRDAYAACDAVLLPSTWDPTGAGAIESIIADRPCVVGSFPILGELQAIGLRFFHLDEPAELVKFLARPERRLLDVNRRRARLSFGAEHLPAKVAEVLMAVEPDA